MFPDFLSAAEEAMQAFFPFQWPIRISNESLCELVQALPRNHAHYGAAKLTETFFHEKGEERMKAELGIKKREAMSQRIRGVLALKKLEG
jgi:hypothetical protein